MNPLLQVGLFLVIGTTAAILSGRFLPLSGKAALGVALLPLAGYGLTRAFC